MANKWVTVQTRGLTDDTMGVGLYKKVSLICLPFLFYKVCIRVKNTDPRFPCASCVDISFVLAFATSNVKKFRWSIKR